MVCFSAITSYDGGGGIKSMGWMKTAANFPDVCLAKIIGHQPYPFVSRAPLSFSKLRTAFPLRLKLPYTALFLSFISTPLGPGGEELVSYREEEGSRAIFRPTCRL
jgi:hypothetical protein